MSNNKHTLIPKLRFPEFQKEGEWEVKKVGDILVESKIPLKINDLEKRITVRLNLKGVEKREYRGTESENATYFFERKKGQFIYGKQNLHKGAFGIISEELDGYASSQDLPAFDFKNGFFPKFFLHYLSQETVYPELEKIATGTGSKRIHPKEFYNVSIPVPSLPEQQKIASCLSSLDEVITGEQQKLELLKQHKKGLLQNLFPQAGETVPKIRFKEFENSGEWEVKKLGELCVEIKEKTNGRKFKLLSISSGQGLISQIEKFGKEIAGNSYSNYTVIRKNDFAYNKSSTKSYPEGEIALMEEEEDCAVPNSIFTCFRFKQNLIIPYFAKYLFVKNHHGRYLRTLIAIGARAHGALQISTRDLFSVPIPFPSLPEQQKNRFMPFVFRRFNHRPNAKNRTIAAAQKRVVAGVVSEYQ